VARRGSTSEAEIERPVHAYSLTVAGSACGRSRRRACATSAGRSARRSAGLEGGIAAEREQWNDANNVLALAPGVVRCL
jgi:hypothetical protein